MVVMRRSRMTTRPSTIVVSTPRPVSLKTSCRATLLTVPETDGAGPIEPAVPPPPAIAEPDPLPAEVGDAGAPPDVLPETEAADAITLGGEPEVSDVWTATNDGTRKASHRHRLLHTAGLGLAILTVAVGGILGVMALRSASESHDAPTDVETPAPVTTVPPARPA